MITYGLALALTFLSLGLLLYGFKKNTGRLVLPEAWFDVEEGEPGEKKPIIVLKGPTKEQSDEDSAKPKKAKPDQVGPTPIASSASSEEELQNPGYVVKMAVSGFAVIEGPDGARNVIVGMEIPGAGLVKSIDRVGEEWVVVTSETVIGSHR
ncbi:hypothetical protein [Microvirga sp. 2TAF3]|uniref:hypothetical protein n=1 Tax=Microvirga sp. 2TAF3 TaxID=3233014 RepID=UPI003F9571F6